MFPLFFLLGLLLMPLLKDFNDPGFGLGILFTATGMVLAALVIGWVKDFPRWVFPYWGMALLISLYMHSFTGTIAGYQVRGGWWVWTPLVGVVLVGWLWRRRQNDPLPKLVEIRVRLPAIETHPPVQAIGGCALRVGRERHAVCPGCLRHV